MKKMKNYTPTFDEYLNEAKTVKDFVDLLNSFDPQHSSENPVNAKVEGDGFSYYDNYGSRNKEGDQAGLRVQWVFNNGKVHQVDAIDADGKKLNFKSFKKMLAGE